MCFASIWLLAAHATEREGVCVRFVGGAAASAVAANDRVILLALLRSLGSPTRNLDIVNVRSLVRFLLLRGHTAPTGYAAHSCLSVDVDVEPWIAIT